MLLFFLYGYQMPTTKGAEMHYMVMAKQKWLYDSFLISPIPYHVLEMMEVQFVEKELELCRLCDVQGARCHVQCYRGDGWHAALCPVLFWDALKPKKWKVADL